MSVKTDRYGNAQKVQGNAFKVRATFEAECDSCGNEETEVWHYTTPSPYEATYWRKALEELREDFGKKGITDNQLDRIVIERIS